MPDSPLQRRDVCYSGHVQGVGFRYTTVRVANGYSVTGWVRNLPDGRVQVVVEGSRSELNAFLADLARKMSGYIREVVSDNQPPTGEFTDFTIRH